MWNDIGQLIAKELRKPVQIQPIATELQKHAKKRDRIWLCPTGIATKLPLHAAGRYEKGNISLSNIFNVSYTPTLAALIRARQPRTSSVQQDPSKTILLVGQPDTPGQAPLRMVRDEIETIRKGVPGATTLLSREGLRQKVLDELGSHRWLHLACHGHHHAEQPFLSHFAMYDGPISLLDLIQKDLPHAELAFLSASHSARTGGELPNEALNPATGMLFSGFRSVVGTMWALEDGFGCALAGEFWKQIFGGENGPRDYTEVVECVRKAFAALDKGRYPIPLIQRINVVHFGV